MDIIYSDLKEQELNLLKNKIQSRLKISHCLVVIFLIGALLDEILLVFSVMPIFIGILIAVLSFPCGLLAGKKVIKYLSIEKDLSDTLYIFYIQKEIRNLDLNDQDIVHLIKTMNKKGKWDLRIVIRKQKRECAIMYEFELPTEALINIEDKILDFRFIDEKFEKLKGEI